ncbi:SDR family oxidoreductase [Candidatus Woesearchaeota archaeon]|nr:SDR family oxidoreductase [Candidatus Woesearchaeota archaeon]
MDTLQNKKTHEHDFSTSNNENPGPSTCLANKTVLVTGSSIGIGKETAFLFAKEKCKVIITYYKDKEEASLVLKKCIDAGSPEAYALKLNVMDNASIMKLVKTAVGKFKKIDILVNNAGHCCTKELNTQTFEDTEAQIRTNLEGLIKITKAFLPYINEMIINIGSGAGKKGYKDLTTYCATKFGVRGFTQALAEEFPALKIYCVNPGRTATRMTNFKGRPCEQVAAVIVNASKGIYPISQDHDIDVWDVLK